MITDVNLSSRTMMSRPLKRGRACMNCRFLKIKCDGMKPVCGPCRKHPKDDDCEYSDGPARSRTKALEDTVQRLEARLHELEHPEDSTPSVTLYDPYAPTQFPPQLSISPTYAGPSSRSLPSTPYHQLPRVLSPTDSSPESQGFTPLSPFSPSSTTATTPPFGGHGHGTSPLGIFDTRVIATPESTSSSLESDQNIYEALLQVFRPHACQFGFFLSWGRLTQPTVPKSSALLNAIYMWGAHLSSDRQRELYFKQKALQSVAAELTPESFLHIIQAEVLLSYYFFRTGHFLEARAHTATAVALALGGGLHLIRSLNHPDAPVIEITEDNDQEIQLRASADSVEEGERINSFWAVFMLQKNLAVALEPPARVCGVFEAGGMPIDTPWPLEMEDYKQGLLTSDIHGDSTVRNFLQHTGAVYPERSSITAMNVKASILLHRAVYMHGQYRPGCPERETQSWWTAFGAVDQLINTLRAELPDLTQVQGRSSARTILLTHSLLDAATIKLHSIFYTDPTSRQNCLAAARDMFRFGGTNPQGLGYLNPMMGTLWMTACNVFIDELRRIRAESAQSMWPLQVASEQEREKEMLASLNDGLDALSVFARESLLMRHQLTKVQESIEAT
ncbi:hypothetical protein R3P38DRAFT_2599373 [Favolaschia claudopus]|uniref:Zn(2)-C6 fungal-type domain-containing protein n=1 Tax=Favolaschia claudopus TaxID=2862362 RepID=A0AAW0DYE5_9AGAR